jgi:hypothetical protein
MQELAGLDNLVPSASIAAGVGKSDGRQRQASLQLAAGSLKDVATSSGTLQPNNDDLPTMNHSRSILNGAVMIDTVSAALAPVRRRNGAAIDFLQMPISAEEENRLRTCNAEVAYLLQSIAARPAGIRVGSARTGLIITFNLIIRVVSLGASGFVLLAQTRG